MIPRIIRTTVSSSQSLISNPSFPGFTRNQRDSPSVSERLTAYPLWQYPIWIYYQKMSDATRDIPAFFFSRLLVQNDLFRQCIIFIGNRNGRIQLCKSKGSRDENPYFPINQLAVKSGNIEQPAIKAKTAGYPPAVLFIYVYFFFSFGFQYTRTTSPQCGHFSSTMILNRVMPISKIRLPHLWFGHLIFWMMTTSSPKNAEAHIGISQ